MALRSRSEYLAVAVVSAALIVFAVVAYAGVQRPQMGTGPYVPHKDFLFEVSKGVVKGHVAVSRYGRNPDVDAASGFFPLWGGGPVFTGHDATVAEPMSLVSDDAADTSAGAGAQTVEISGLDGNFDEISEVVSLSGTTPAVSALSYIRLDTLKVITAGASGENEGTITAAQSVTTANVFGTVQPGFNISQIGAYTVPNGKSAFVFSWFAGLSSSSQADAVLRLKRRPVGEVYRSAGDITVRASGTSTVTREFSTPRGPIPSRADIVVDVDVDSNNSSIGAGFHIVIVDE